MTSPQSAAASYSNELGSKTKSESIITHGGSDSVHGFTQGGKETGVRPFSPALSHECSFTTSAQHAFLLLSVSCSNAAVHDSYAEHSEQNAGQQTRGVSAVASMMPVLQNSSLPSSLFDRRKAVATIKSWNASMFAEVTVLYCPCFDCV